MAESIINLAPAHEKSPIKLKAVNKVRQLSLLQPVLGLLWIRMARHKASPCFG